MKGAALLLLVTGCFSKPDAPAVRPIDAPLDSPPFDTVDACLPSVSAPGLASSTSIAPTVTWPAGMQLRFADVTTSIPMPDTLSLGNGNVLAMPQVAQCGTEDQAGVAVFPAFAVSTSSVSASFTLKALDRIVVGPAYSEYTVHWARMYTCGATTASASGNTIFSLFPDGRIVRNDTITPADQTVAIDDTCDCTPGMMANGFLVTAYLALQRSLFGAFSVSGAPEAAVPGSMPDFPDEQGACAVENGVTPGRIAVAWDTPPPAPARTRLRSVGTGTAAELVFVYDLFSGPSLNSGTRGGRTTMVMSRDARTCPQLHALARSSWPPISIGPAGMALGLVNSAERRVHVDSNQYTGPIEVRATNGAVPAGLVISVRIPGMGLTTSRTDGVIWQKEADGRTFIWFRDGLAPNETITITPDC